MPSYSKAKKNRNLNNERGNILFIILLAIVLIGLLSAVITNSSNTESANIDKERMAILIAQVQRQASEFERGVQYILQNGYRESQIRFAHPQAHSDYGDLSADTDRGDQLFASEGGAVTYRNGPELITSSQWEFYGNSIIPSVGSDLPDLIAVLPDVTQQFCEEINTINGQVQPTDTATCIDSGATMRFRDAVQFDGATNAIPATDFTLNPQTSQPVPALQACVQCGSDYHFYHVLIAR